MARRIPSYGQVGNSVVNTTDPQFGDGTSTPNPDETDPLTALHTLVLGGGAFNPPAYTGPTTRNSAIAGAIRGKYGLGKDNGDISQSDLEALDSFVRGRDVQDKTTEEAVAPTIQGQTARDVEGMKGQYDLQSEGMKGQTARDVANIQNVGKIVPAQLKEAGTAMDPQQVDWLAQQASRDFNGVMGKIPTAMKKPVLDRLAQLDANPQSPTNQQRQMSEASNDILDTIDRNNYTGQAENLHNQGLFTPVVGTVRRFAAQHGAGTLLGMGDQTASDLGQFETTHGLLMSMIQRAHAGARGAGNSEMAARFEKLLADQGDLPTFLGELKGMRGLLEQYASHTNPTRGFSTGAPAATGEDLGANWGGR